MKGNIFQKARIKLTLYYIVIMGVILFVFSSAIIFPLEAKVRRGFSRERFPSRIEGVPQAVRIKIDGDDLKIEDPVRDTVNDIKFVIYTIDWMLLIAIGGLSYFLAGKTLAPIKEALDAQKKFSADASHDLRTPLAIMTTEAEVTLQNKNATVAELRETIESNLEETNKMARLVQDLLIISRGDNQANIHSFSQVDVYEYINKIVNKIKPNAEKKGLKINISDKVEILARIDKNNFERVISNVVQNAVKYTKHGSISVDIKKIDSSFKIKIVDTGVGIKEEDLPHVFDRFYKAEHSRNDDSGSGLGLPIAGLIVKEHKGDISVSSKIGVGTTVEITVPLGV